MILVIVVNQTQREEVYAIDFATHSIAGSIIVVAVIIFPYFSPILTSGENTSDEILV